MRTYHENKKLTMMTQIDSKETDLKKIKKTTISMEEDYFSRVIA